MKTVTVTESPLSPWAGTPRRTGVLVGIEAPRERVGPC